MVTICCWFTHSMCEFYYTLYKYQARSWCYQRNANATMAKMQKYYCRNQQFIRCHPIMQSCLAVSNRRCFLSSDTRNRSLVPSSVSHPHIHFSLLQRKTKREGLLTESRKGQQDYVDGMGWDTNYRYWFCPTAFPDGVCSFLQECKTTLYSFYQHHKTLDMNDLMVVEQKHFVE